MKNFPTAFLTAVALSLAGFANLGFAERYETVIVKTDDTASVDHTSAQNYLKSSACISTQVLQIQEGEVAYVFNVGALVRPGATIQHTNNQKKSFVSVLVDLDGIESNQTIGTWNPQTASFSSDTSSDNVATNSQPISGPATVKILIKPWSG
ncbi:MAG: hypothetical protein HN531_14950, partial [Opitutae bacterium]|nr:hypothetical protein [Opitutae bacterium]